jgi:hypothetical protein
VDSYNIVLKGYRLGLREQKKEVEAIDTRPASFSAERTYILIRIVTALESFQNVEEVTAKLIHQHIMFEQGERNY